MRLQKLLFFPFLSLFCLSLNTQAFSFNAYSFGNNIENTVCSDNSPCETDFDDVLVISSLHMLIDEWRDIIEQSLGMNPIESCDSCEKISFSINDLNRLWQALKPEEHNEYSIKTAYTLFTYAKSAYDENNIAKARLLLIESVLRLTIAQCHLTDENPLDVISNMLTNRQEELVYDFESPSADLIEQEIALYEFIIKKLEGEQSQKAATDPLLSKNHLTLEENAEDLSNEGHSPNVDNPTLPSSVLDTVKPHLIPSTHPLVPWLNHIFLSSRATYSDDTLTAAGFTILHKQPRSFIRLVSHPLLPGHILKLNLDTDLRKKQHKPEWYWFANRCAGVKKIDKAIKNRKAKYFTAPSKHIYVLPFLPQPTSVPGVSLQVRHVVLVAAYLDVAPQLANFGAWQNLISKPHLDELYYILSYAPGFTSRIDNIPYCMSGKFAFIDTESTSSKANLQTIRSYLSPSMLSYWDGLIKKGGKR